MAKTTMQKLSDTALALTGGAAAGYVDGKYPRKLVVGDDGVQRPEGMPMSLWVGAALAGLGFSGVVGGKTSELMLSAGEGALSFAVGTMVAERTTPVPEENSGTAGVGRFMGRGNMRALGRGRAVSHAQVQQSIAALRRRAA